MGHVDHSLPPFPVPIKWVSKHSVLEMHASSRVHRARVFTCPHIKRLPVNDEPGALEERSSLSLNNGLQCHLPSIKNNKAELDLNHLSTVVEWISGVILKATMIPHSALRQRLNVNQTQRVKILTAGSSVLQLAPVVRHAKFVTSSSAPPRRAPGHQRSHRQSPKI